jgi:hypothetical protein
VKPDDPYKRNQPPDYPAAGISTGGNFTRA